MQLQQPSQLLLLMENRMHYTLTSPNILKPNRTSKAWQQIDYNQISITVQSLYIVNPMGFTT